jgi:hypothetical protein
MERTRDFVEPRWVRCPMVLRSISGVVEKPLDALSPDGNPLVRFPVFGSGDACLLISSPTGMQADGWSCAVAGGRGRQRGTTKRR